MTRRWDLCQGLQCLLDFKGSSPQAIRRSSIVARSNTLVKKPVNGLCHKPPNLSQLKGWQLQLDISHHRPAHKNGILQASQSYNRYTGSSRSDHWCSCMSPRSSGVNCHGSRLVIYIQVLIITVLLFRDQKEAISSLPLPNRYLDQEIK